MEEVFHTVRYRLIDSTWTVVFKALIVIHLMIHDGVQDATLQCLAEHPQKIAMDGFSECEFFGRPAPQGTDKDDGIGMQYHRRRDTGFGDMRNTSFPALTPSPMPKPTMFEAGPSD